MKKDYSKLKRLFINDPEVLRALEQQEQADLMKEILNKKVSLDGIEKIEGKPGFTPKKGIDYLTDTELEDIKVEITPVRGVDYFTPDDVEEIKAGIKEEVTPLKGVDYFDGVDADEGKIIRSVSQNLIKHIPTVKEIAAQIPKPKNIDTDLLLKEFLKHIPEDVDLTVEDIVKEIKEKKLLDISDLRNWRSSKSDSKGFDMNDQRWHGGGGGGNPGDAEWIPLGVTTAGAGGILTGTDLGTDPVSIQTTLREIFYPASRPTTTLNTTPPAGLYEVGDTQPTVDLSSTTTQGTLPITTFEFKKNGVTIYTDPTPNPSGGTETYSDTDGVSTNTIYQAIVGDGVYTGTATATFTFVSAYYYGSAAPGLDISSDGGGLTKLVIGNTATLSELFSPTVEVYYFAYPAAYPALTSILDKNGFETISDWTVSTVDVTNSFGSTVSYRQYEFNNLTTQTDFQNTFIQ